MIRLRQRTNTIHELQTLDAFSRDLLPDFLITPEPE